MNVDKAVSAIPTEQQVHSRLVVDLEERRSPTDTVTNFKIVTDLVYGDGRWTALELPDDGDGPLIEQ